MKLNKDDMYLFEQVLKEFFESPIKTQVITKEGLERLGAIRREFAHILIPELRCSEKEMEKWGKELAEEYLREGDKIITFHINRD